MLLVAVVSAQPVARVNTQHVIERSQQNSAHFINVTVVDDVYISEAIANATAADPHVAEKNMRRIRAILTANIVRAPVGIETFSPSRELVVQGSLGLADSKSD